MPHRRDVEAAADPELRGAVREVQRHHQHVWNALRALALEMMLGHPERVVAVPVHHLGHRLGLEEGGRQVLVVVAALIDRRALVAAIVEIGVACEQAVELGDHVASPACKTLRAASTVAPLYSCPDIPAQHREGCKAREQISACVRPARQLNQRFLRL